MTICSIEFSGRSNSFNCIALDRSAALMAAAFHSPIVIEFKFNL